MKGIGNLLVVVLSKIVVAVEVAGVVATVVVDVTALL